MSDRAAPSNRVQRINSEKKGFKPAVHWDVTVQPYFKAAFGASGLDKLSEALCRPPLINSFRLNLAKTPREVCTPLCSRAASLMQMCSFSATKCCTPLQIALSHLSEAPDSVDEAHANRWSGHPNVPDVISQKGTGPHVVDYQKTAGKHLWLVIPLYMCTGAQRPATQRLLLPVSVIKPHLLHVTAQMCNM